jgi:hypothetical protein
MASRRLSRVFEDHCEDLPSFVKKYLTKVSLSKDHYDQPYLSSASKQTNKVPMEREPPPPELGLITRMPWACAQCTYYHTGDEAAFLACTVGPS